MTNTSIKNAFQRMWEHMLAKLPNLPNISTADTGKLLTVDQNGEWTMAENAFVDISFEAIVLASNWSADKTNGYYTNQVDIIGIKAAYNPQVDLVITSAELAEEERIAMGQIIEAETFDGYVIFRALEAPSINLNIKFSGMFANATDDLATKDYVDSIMEAEEISYDNSSSGMTATTTQGAIDELYANKLPVSGGTLTGTLVAQTNANYTTRQVRNIIISTSDPTSSNGQNGDIWVKYKA